MRILIDATAVGEGRGGIVTYLRELLRAWREAGYDDDLLVAGTHRLPPSIDAALDDAGRVVRRSGRYPASRFIVQHVRIPALARTWKPDVLLASTPVVPLLWRGPPVVAVLYDLRYLRRPDEFRRLQRWYRTLMYGLGLRRAAAILAISGATQRDAIRAFPRLDGRVRTVYLGADHVVPGEGVATGSHGIAFAHWSNKRPDLSIRAWGQLRVTRDDFSNVLHVVGVPAADRPALAAIAAECRVAEQVSLHEYLDDEAFGRLFSTARVVLMPSTLEGFGLPVVEAMRLGVPVVASDDPAMREAGGDSALYASADSPAALAGEVARVLFDDELHRRMVRAGREQAARFTWRRTVDATRAALVAALGDRGAS